MNFSNLLCEYLFVCVICAQIENGKIKVNTQMLTEETKWNIWNLSRWKNHWQIKLFFKSSGWVFVCLLWLHCPDRKKQDVTGCVELNQDRYGTHRVVHANRKKAQPTAPTGRMHPNTHWPTQWQNPQIFWMIWIGNLTRCLAYLRRIFVFGCHV